MSKQLQLYESKELARDQLITISKTTASLSVSTLVLSFAFVDHFTPGKKFAILLIGFWVSILVSVWLTAVSWLSISLAAKHAMAHLRRTCFESEGTISFVQNSLEKHRTEPYLDPGTVSDFLRTILDYKQSANAVYKAANWTRRSFAYHHLSLMFFVLGYALLTLYAALNLH